MHLYNIQTKASSHLANTRHGQDKLKLPIAANINTPLDTLARPLERKNWFWPFALKTGKHSVQALRLIFGFFSTGRVIRVVRVPSANSLLPSPHPYYRSELLPLCSYYVFCPQAQPLAKRAWEMTAHVLTELNLPESISPEQRL